MEEMRVYFIIFLLLILYEATAQLSENVDKTEILTLTDDEDTAQEEACLTVRNLQGICVIRERCDYGPGAIDFTLYVPSWYKRPCEADEVCCPPEYLVEIRIPPPPFESFEFDDDD